MLQRVTSVKLSGWTLFGIVVLTASFFVSSVYRPWFDTFAIQPSDFFVTWYFSRFFTFWLVTNEQITHWLTVLALVIFDKLVHDCWSKFEVCLFVSFVNLSSVFCSTVILNLIDVYPTITLHGNAALIAAFSVVATQFDSERYLFGYGSTGLKSRYGFFAGLMLYMFSALLSIVSWPSVLLYTNGFFFSWLYLRFLQHHPQRKYGDHRACFTFSKFFPGPLEGCVAVPSNMIYRLLLISKLCPGIERQSEIVSTASFAVDIPGMTSDTDRHRQLALKALSERLLTKSESATDQVDWPNLDEPEEATVADESAAVVKSVIVDVTSATPVNSEQV